MAKRHGALLCAKYGSNRAAAGAVARLTIDTDHQDLDLVGIGNGIRRIAAHAPAICTTMAAPRCHSRPLHNAPGDCAHHHLILLFGHDGCVICPLVAAGGLGPNKMLERLTPKRHNGPGVHSSDGAFIARRGALKVQPSRAHLEFPAQPQPEDFFRSHVLEEPLVPVGSQPTTEENAALAAALLNYSKRTSVDDFSSLTDFLGRYPKSAWCAALLTDLGIDYYNSAHYSQALEAWNQAWSLARNTNEPRAKALADRAGGELAYMYGRLGRMTELEAFLDSAGKRVFVGPSNEKISSARAGLWEMKTRPEISFRCGPMALQRIKVASGSKDSRTATLALYKSASTQKGFSLTQVAEISKDVGLNYQMAFRPPGAAMVVPSVVHWKVGHYAAVIREEDGRYLLEDSTFRNNVWATKSAIEAEASGYFLIPPGPLPDGWRSVETQEGSSIWGKPSRPFEGHRALATLASMARFQQECS